MTKQKIKDSIISSVSILGVVLVAIVALILQNNTEEWVTHSNNVKIDVVEVFDILQGSESDLRGYLLTSDSNYLQSFSLVKEKIDSRLEALKTMTSDNPLQQATLTRFTAHSNAKFDIMQRTFQTYESGKVAEAIAIVNTDKGEFLMDKLEEMKEDILLQENRLLYERQANNILLQRVSLLLLALATLLAGYSIYRLYNRIGPLINSLDMANANLRSSIEEKNRELTLRKRLENRNKQLIERLTSKNEELNHFAYIASHDLQEPLRTVNNFIEVFKEDYGEKLDSDAQQYFDYITGATGRMKALIEGLLNYSRLGKSRGAEIVNLTEVLTAARENLAATIQSKKAVVEVGQMPAVKCMKTETTQLFQNLINNAIKYTAPGVAPKVVISAQETDDLWEFRIKDNGIGIPEAQQGKIFNMFSRLHGDGDYQGQGIGLAFCKKIVELHGGRIWLTSEPGQGSTFYFTISKKLKDGTEAEQNFID